MISAGHEILGATAGPTGSGEYYLISMSKEGVKVSSCIPVHLAIRNYYCSLIRNPGIGIRFHQCYILELQYLYLLQTHVRPSLVNTKVHLHTCRRASEEEYEVIIYTVQGGQIILSDNGPRHIPERGDSYSTFSAPL